MKNAKLVSSKAMLFVLGQFLMQSALADAPAGAPASVGIMGMLPPMLLMFGVVYFMMLRPQQKKMKEHQQLIAALKHGDEIMTTSGILGKVTGITEKVVTVEIADNVRVKMLKSQVAQVVKDEIKDLA